MRYSFYILLLMVTVFTSFAQVEQEWVRTYSGSGQWSDQGRDVLVTSNSVYVTGFSLEIGSRYDICTMKYDLSGNLNWLRLFNGPFNYNDYGYGIKADQYGNIFVLGSMYVDSNNSALVLIKYSEAGNIIWNQKIDSCYPVSMILDTLGNVYVTGWNAFYTDNINILTAKYNNNGTREWKKTYDGFGFEDRPFSLDLDIFGNVYVGGFTQTQLHPYYRDYVLLKYDNNGNNEWVRTYNGPGNLTDEIHSVKTDLAGNVIVTGSSCRVQSFSEDYCTIKYTIDGNSIWQRRYNGPVDYTDIPNDMVIDSLGNIYITGSQYTSNQRSYDVCTLSYDSSGVLRWTSVFNSNSNGLDAGRKMTFNSANKLFITGISFSSIQNDYDFILIGYNTLGAQLNVNTYTSTGNYEDTPYGIFAYKNDIFITGYSGGDIATVKYNVLLGLSTISTEIPQQFSLHQNYPNPFNPSTKIKFSIHLSRGVSEGRGVFTKLKIFDILGREVRTLVNENLEPGVYEIDFNTADLPSGVYFYKLTAGEFVDTKKMILMK